jgi:hypothetical protein
MMSQSSTGIFATPGAFVPVLPRTSTASKSTFAALSLIVSNHAGQVLQTITVNRPKSTLGSAKSCTICCDLPGIAPVHALIVCGSKQMFVRTLAGKLSQDGVATSELLLTEDRCYFELAGYHFAMNRSTKSTPAEEIRNERRMRFALSRPLSISAQPELIEAAEPATASSPTIVANIIRQAIEPLEAQIESLLLPLAEFQSQSLQEQVRTAQEEQVQREAENAHRREKEQQITTIVAQQAATMDALAERFSDVNQQLSTIERIITKDAETFAATTTETNKVVAIQQTAIEQLQSGMVSTMDALAERFSHVNQQLSTIERNIAKDADTFSAATTETNKVVAIQQTAIEQLQTGMVSVADSLKQLQERQIASQKENATWKSEVQVQLQQLTDAVSEFSSIAEKNDQTAVVEAIESLRLTHDTAQQEIQRWQAGVQLQLNGLEEQLQLAATAEDNTVTPDIAATIADALAQIQAKHENSLQELQSWKAELRLEIQQLLQSAPINQIHSPPAVEPAAADGLKASEQLTAFASVSVAVAPQPASTAQNRPEFEAAIEPAAELGMSSFVTVEEHTAVDQEPITPEFISDQAFDEYQAVADESALPEWHSADAPDSQATAETPNWPEDSVVGWLEEPASAWQPAEPEQAEEWPTLAVDARGQNITDSQFSDPWTATEQEALIEDQSAPISEVFNWDAAEPTQADSQLANWLDSAAQVRNYEPPAAAVSAVPANPPPSTFKQDEQEFEIIPEIEIEASNFIAPQLEIQSSSLPAPLTAPGDLDHFPEHQPEQSNYHEPSWADDHQTTTPESSNNHLPTWWEDDNSQSSPSAVAAKPVVELEHFDAVSNSPAAKSDSILDISSLFRNSADAEELLQAAGKDRDQVKDDEEFFGFGVESEAAAPPEPSVDDVDYETNKLQNYFKNESRSSVLDQSHSEPGPARHSITETERSLSDAFRAEPIDPEMDLQPIATDSEDEDSVESYMKSLLARMRGGSVEANQANEASIPNKSTSATSTNPSSEQRVPSNQATNDQVVLPTENTDPIDFDNFMPLTSAPEKTRNISALRDLANSTARSAIHKSTRRRTLSSGLMKFAISAIGFTVAAALFAINGLAVNIALIASLAASCVGVIWGVDGIKRIAPLLQNSLVLNPQAEALSQSQDSQEPS